MGLVVCADAERAAIEVADLIEAAVRNDPRLRLGLATGRTATRAYAELVRRYHASGDLTFRHVTTFNTDEFVGIAPEDPRSTRFTMNTRLFNSIDIRLEHTHVPRGDAEDVELECRAYESLIRARGGLDLVVLGLGHNGHIGFNEPGSSPRSRTRVVEFTESTVAALSDGQRCRNLSETPTRAVTIGLATILEARRLVLVATGIAKAQAVHRAVDCRPGPSVPASQLLAHPGLTIVVDREAASAIDRPSLEVGRV